MNKPEIKCSQTGYEKVQSAVAPFSVPVDVYDDMLKAVVKWQDEGFKECDLVAEILSMFCSRSRLPVLSAGSSTPEGSMTDE